MAIEVIEKINISGSEDHIASYMFDPTNDTNWISGVMEVKNVTELPLREGTEIHRIAHFLGKDVDYILRVNKFEKANLLSMESVKGPFPMQVTYSIEQNIPDNNEGNPKTCSVKIQISGESKGYFMFIDRLLSLMVSQNVKGDLRKLKNIIEGEEEGED